ncbi:MAG: hypothetical protein EA360_09690 [Balneolaceae bacterium]|nr:MAG: hypothetical protein EA360_09690 [Balneolaceae bacterium]
MIQRLKKILGRIKREYDRRSERIRLRDVYKEMSPYLSKDINQIFDGKRVAIIGPADSAMLEENGDYIDRFDLIIRLNKGYQLVEIEGNDSFIGSRTDVLFSRLDIRESLDPETFDFELLTRQKIQHLIGFWRTEKFGAYHRILSFIRDYKGLFGEKVSIITKEKYIEIMKSIGFAKPSVGYIALCSVLESKAKLLYLTGITFYLTEYQPGYRDDVTKESQLSKFRQREDGHNPEMERVAFLKLYKNHKERIELDAFLTKHLRETDGSV